MKLLYCPLCGEYLEGGSGDLVDCYCGWKQPQERYEPQKEYSDEEWKEAVLEILKAAAERDPLAQVLKDYAEDLL